MDDLNDDARCEDEATDALSALGEDFVPPIDVLAADDAQAGDGSDDAPGPECDAGKDEEKTSVYGAWGKLGASGKVVFALTWDPLTISRPKARRDAWYRLAAFVDYLNATWGAMRISTDRAPFWIPPGWWNNPIAVTHLAALAQAWTAHSVSLAHPLMGSDNMLHLLLDRIPVVLERVVGKADETHKWGLGRSELTWEPGSPLDPQAQQEARDAFARFVDGDSPTSATTWFTDNIIMDLSD